MFDEFTNNFFAIDLTSMNLFSFMMGMMFAFFNQGLFGKRIGKYRFIYFLGLVAVYASKYYIADQANKQMQVVEQTESFFIPVPR
jgi:hypothetical protein